MGLIIWLVNAVYRILTLFIFVRVIISWLRPGYINSTWRRVLSFIYSVTEPILGPIRELLPTGRMGIDFSPLVALFVLYIIRNFVIRLLSGLMYNI